MALKDDLENDVAQIFRSQWSEREGQAHPAVNSIRPGNDGVNIEATVLHAVISNSTRLVDNYKPAFAAEVYKAFLHCATRIIGLEGGEISTYHGGRVMAVFTGDSKDTTAVRTAMKITSAVTHIIQPALNAEYPNTDFVLKHVVGIDSSGLLVARAGIGDNHDLLCVGRAANYAAMLSTLADSHSKYITKKIYDTLHDDLKVSKGQPIWEAVPWKAFDNRIIYRSTWSWNLS